MTSPFVDGTKVTVHLNREGDREDEVVGSVFKNGDFMLRGDRNMYRWRPRSLGITAIGTEMWCAERTDRLGSRRPVIFPSKDSAAGTSG